MKRKEKTIPVLFVEKKDCYGCSACYSVCPAGQSAWKETRRGFGILKLTKINAKDVDYAKSAV